jgi:outer membrane protein insertion porin family
MEVGARLVRGLGLAACLLGGIFFSCALAGVTTAGIAVAQTAGSIVVEGNRRVEADTIRSYFRAAPGGRLDAAQIDQGLKGLYATGLFQDVRINQSGGRLIVTVVENPVINRVAFEGNKKVKDEQLATEVQSKARGTFSRPVVQADTQRIIEIYRRNGRFDVRVVPKMIELPNNRIDLVFEITEGAKTGVKKIRFVGNNNYSDGRLKDVIKTGESNFLSWLKSNDVYDADRIEADRDLLRRFYLKHGFADVHIVAAVAEYDPEQKGFIVTYSIEEGARYKFGSVDVQSGVRAVNADDLRSKLKTQPGDVYNAEAVEKTVENMSIEVARHGYPFATVRPRGERDFERHLINIIYFVEEGARAYIERLNIRGNTRTRDYVIRREFDLSEGDAYNRALIDRAERRLKNLNYFKTVKITNEPGSAPDRVVVNVDVEEQSTGEFSISGGYSTADGFLAEVSVAERNLLGHGQFARVAVQYGERTKGFELSFVEPYFLGYRLGAGFDIFAKQTSASTYTSYDSKSYGFNLKAGIILSEELSFAPRYTLYRQEITLPAQLTNCVLSPAALANGGLPPGVLPGDPCYSDGEASLPVRIELAQGPVLVSLLGYSLAYNTLDNNKNPTSGLYAEFRQDFAGVGGDVNFIRSTADARYYFESFPDVVSFFRLQGGHLAGWGGRNVRMLDHFQMGPNLVRGFAPNGIGPRDVVSPNSTQDALGGTMYWGASVEFQVPLYFIPKDVGLRGAVFADAGSLWNYKGPTFYPVTGETIIPSDSNSIRSAVGVGLVWDSPFGPLRFDYSFPLTKEGYDRVQQFRFGGGTKF